MKAHITFTDDNGVVLEGDADLVPRGAVRVAGKRTNLAPKERTTPKAAPAKLNFALNPRAFIKAHAQGLNGPKKFVLLLAYLAKGVVGTEIELKNVHKQWDKMTASTLLGSRFNRFYSNTAKDNGWVDAPRQGIYVLSPSWKEAVEE
jgi:hypothetical protein